MPSVSPAQARFMAMLANNPKRAKAAGVPVSVAKKYHEADKRKGMMLGGKKDK